MNESIIYGLIIGAFSLIHLFKHSFLPRMIRDVSLKSHQPTFRMYLGIIKKYIIYCKLYCIICRGIYCSRYLGLLERANLR